MNNKPTIVFFGTDSFSVTVLNELKAKDFAPDLIITVPDRPKGRKLILTPSEAKVWAKENDIPTMEPEVLDEEFVNKLKEKEWDLFITASYGKIIPQSVLDIPTKGPLNVHPSLLPLYRGASPIESAMLDDMKETGVTIMLMDAKMDHGSILNQEVVEFDEWPKKKEVEDNLAKLGGQLLCQTIPLWINGDIEEQEQDHEMATFTKKIKKEDGLIDLDGNTKESYLKIKALNPWPGTFYFVKKGDKEIRVKITDASFIKGKFKILKVIPEGKKEMDFDVFEKGL
ncbi:MAG: methionyl-tRNA formyltransferase [Candidatus Paceibacteria bacterium]|jgi:methionyl-tRNA formyltransferase